MMGTRENKDLLDGAGLLADAGRAAAPADLVIAISADGEAAAQTAREAAERALDTRRQAGSATTGHARSLAGGRSMLADANLALISVPGRYAGVEARRALASSLHVMLFSDNVPVETEVELKRLALDRGLLLMGPDCGT